MSEKPSENPSTATEEPKSEAAQTPPPASDTAKPENAPPPAPKTKEESWGDYLLKPEVRLLIFQSVTAVTDAFVESMKQHAESQKYVAEFDSKTKIELARIPSEQAQRHTAAGVEFMTRLINSNWFWFCIVLLIASGGFLTFCAVAWDKETWVLSFLGMLGFGAGGYSIGRVHPRQQ